ncbi:hypothetical protein [Streptomyces solaniscabiei]|uniref:hypothetical protein n=1 Tax=Streptomyces solaniscabiei TaxID=2683255 RepID=UPI001CE33B84|nr:hypothetical protein [Streptomyces solaniscabiei]
MSTPQGIAPTPWQEQARVRAAQKRTVRVLSAAQIVGGVGVGVSVSVGPLLAESVAQSETYAGLARTATTAGAALVGIPLALLAHRRGRRTSLGAGWLVAAASADGAGLGLSIVRAVTLAHHGGMTATANRDGGLNILVRFGFGEGCHQEAGQLGRPS